ncbi:anthranilate synthase component I family protein [Aureisphaera galaxeae]|uniref:anthranilate synthase component I family protein n=1 Tax=Aureisphaera galaxeae TaxID=1538023 RepID=UPI0023504D17|nr:anthranilate synthase component I family protein [Aureisphaera galaxeae]MDC8004768.1 anthranilate synthase component I family protein [Aureisphaera galaxeae]
MERILKKYPISLTDSLKRQLLLWAQRYEEVIWLDSNDHNQNHSSYRALLAVDAKSKIEIGASHAFDALATYRKNTPDWMFGYLSYDLKNDVEQLHSRNFDGLQFPDLYFFRPKKVFLFTDTEVEMHYLEEVADEMEKDWELVNQQQVKTESLVSEENIRIRLRTSKDNYFAKVNEMLRHIDRGDIYEANFCQEFFAEQTTIDPIRAFHHLNEISIPPFATFLRLGDLYALSASPERYLRREGTHVVSQPIKGTAKRLEDPVADAEMARFLENDPKERSENIMITDLVRNDLSRFAIKGSVGVEELCKIYSFEQVHQMISTITCEIPEDFPSVSLIKNTFPMGSMTGAPKVSAMKIIENLEDAKRGLYSGAIGYFTPTGDFDFNVVIRSILYNAQACYVSYSVGGAITAKSIPENEYEECLLKAKAMRKVLEG